MALLSERKLNRRKWRTRLSSVETEQTKRKQKCSTVISNIER